MRAGGRLNSGQMTYFIQVSSLLHLEDRKIEKALLWKLSSLLYIFRIKVRVTL